jgi:hypothetical protein
MTRDAIVAKLSAEGYTHFQSYAGAISIDLFDPYGSATGLNPGIEWEGEIVGPGKVIDSGPGTERKGAVLGVWTFSAEAKG